MKGVRVIEQFLKHPIYKVTALCMLAFIILTGNLLNELTKYDYHFKTPVLVWSVLSFFFLILSVVLFALSFQKFINEKNTQLSKMKDDKNQEIDELKKKISTLNEQSNQLIQEHQKNLQGQVQAKERIVKQRNHYAERNAFLEIQNNYQQLFVERIMQTFPEKDISKVVTSIGLEQIKIESQEIKNEED